MLISRTLRLFLDSIGRREEYEFYLKKFQAEQSACFALVFPDSGSLEQSGELLAFDLQLLLRLDLTPLVVLAGDAAEHVDCLRDHLPIRIIDDLQESDSLEAWKASLQPIYAEHQLPVLLRPEDHLDRLVPRLAPKLASRVHLLRLQGMMRSTSGEVIFYHHTRKENAHELPDEELPLVQLAEQWLSSQPRLHVSVASPLNLLQEMFTVRGRGSVIRQGSILSQVPQDQVDTERLLDLFARAFGKSPRDAAILKDITDYVIEENYRGAALLEQHPSGKYLSKFAVGTEARGEGLAQELWDAACASCERLFWRARINNPINQWYQRHANGHHTEGEWIVFWIGIPAEELPGIIRYAIDRPSDFVEGST